MDVLYSGLVEEREASVNERKEEKFSFFLRSEQFNIGKKMSF